MTTGCARERFEVVGVGCEDMVAIACQQDEGRVEDIVAFDGGEQFARRPSKVLVEPSDLERWPAINEPRTSPFSQTA